jgi:DNA replication protein DnaC
MHGQEMQKPINILIHGGPGTGKSFFTRCINNAAKEMDYSIQCVDFTGIAAANLPNGRTIYDQFKFSINDLDKLNQLRSRLSTSKLVKLVIDEISYISPETIVQIHNRLRQLMRKPEILFGGIGVLLMGDFFFNYHPWANLTLSVVQQ